jgi:dimethylargininase
MLIAITRQVSPNIERCELTHLAREEIDVDAAREQHRQYENCLADLGCEVQRLPPAPELPDSVFVEDTAIVLDELAIITRPGAESRRRETAVVVKALEAYRSCTTSSRPGRWTEGTCCVLAKRCTSVCPAGATGPPSSNCAALYAPLATRYRR